MKNCFLNVVLQIFCEPDDFIVNRSDHTLTTHIEVNQHNNVFVLLKIRKKSFRWKLVHRLLLVLNKLQVVNVI